MLEHPIIDVALGLIFFFIILSLVISAIQEWLASFFALRSKNLKAGIEQLVSEKYARLAYAHPLIQNLAKSGKFPSYIHPDTLCTVLLEVVAQDVSQKSFSEIKTDELRSLVNKIDASNPIKAVLNAVMTDGEDAISFLKKELAGWFDEGMTRVSGWYKRQSGLTIVIITGVIVISINGSTIHLAEQLWANDALRTQIAAQAEIAASSGDMTKLETDSKIKLDTFPIGWEKSPVDTVDWLKHFLGWLITIAAVSLGAPFWFDLLGKIANLKGAGGKAKLEKP